MRNLNANSIWSYGGKKASINQDSCQDSILCKVENTENTEYDCKAPIFYLGRFRSKKFPRIARNNQIRVRNILYKALH